MEVHTMPTEQKKPRETRSAQVYEFRLSVFVRGEPGGLEKAAARALRVLRKRCPRGVVLMPDRKGWLTKYTRSYREAWSRIVHLARKRCALRAENADVGASALEISAPEPDDKPEGQRSLFA